MAKKESKMLTIHGDSREDPYYWLNDREDPEVIQYLTEENQYREQMMSHLTDYQDKLFHEIIGRIKQTDISVPYLFNGYYYSTRFDEGKEYPVYLRQKDQNGSKSEVLLEVNELAAPYEFYQIGGRNISPDNRYLAYGEDTLSRRIYT
ncbi:MAG: oligopeptidase B, partial [Saprospiraceae bacterium]|nr:oligopeptidase B [Saprospiraceae bacterium]